MTAAQMTSKAQKLLNDAMSFINRGEYQQAESLVASARELEPTNVDGKHLQGLLATTRRDFATAERLVGEAIDAMPQFAGFYLSMGRIFAQQGKLQQAVNALAECIKRDPKDIAARKLFAHELRLLGDLSSAHKVYDGLIEDGHQDLEIITGLALCVQFAQAEEYDPAIEDRLKRYMAIPEVDYNYLSGYLGTTLIHKYNMGDPDGQLDLDQIACDPLVIEGLRKTYFNSPVVEKTFTLIRQFILQESVQAGAIPEEWVELAASLAVQCFNNEYVYYRSPEEIQLLELLQATAEDATSQGSVNFDELGHALLLLAMYQPLESLGLEAFKGVELAQVPEYLREVYELSYQQMIDEKAKADTIEALTPIEDETSKVVQAMYEKAPYPRWLHLHRQNRTSYLQYIRQYSPLYEGPEFLECNGDEPLKVLIAGCGTGNHALTVATTFNNIHVTAIDISRRSLAYAKNKAEQNGVTNVDFYQADILKLGDIEERFDIIESAGVLHHMNEPEKGWSVLRGLLKPQGVMLIALYSKYARRHIVNLREAIANQGLSFSDDDIREFRYEMLNGRINGDINHVMSLNDFYSLSGTRDLLFHEQEHQFTCGRLKKALNDLELEFIGFSGDGGRVEKALLEYQQMFPADPFRNHLEHWEVYEQQHPDTFIGMYQFFCQPKS